MPFQFNGDEITPCEGLVKYNGVNVRELRFNGTLVHNGIWPPGEPTSLLATDDTCEEIILTWDDPVEQGSGTYIYDLYENGVRINQNVSSPYTHTVRYSTPRSYVVKSVGSDCPDPKASIADDGASNWKPDAPQGFSASNTLCEEIAFNWTNPVEDGFPNATYNIMQGANIVAGGEDVSSPITLPLLDETLLPYYIRATNRCGDGDSIVEYGQAATPPNPVAITASDNLCGKIRINFTPELMTAQYDLWQGANLIQNNISNGFEYTETDRSVLNHHLVQTGHCPADVANSGNNNGQIGWVPNAPTGVTATVNNTGLLGKIRITYTPSTDNGNPNCVYDLYVNGALGPQNIPTTYDYNTSYDGNITFTVKARNTCGSSAASNSATGNAYQKAPPATTTFYSTGTCVPGTGHTLADICIIGGGGGGGYRPQDDNHRGGGGRGGYASQANIANTGNFTVTIGAGGPSLGGGLLGGYPGNPSSALSQTGSGGAAGLSNALVFFGQGEVNAGLCGFGTVHNGYTSTNSGDRSAGGASAAGHGGSGEGVGGNPINGDKGSGGGASFGVLSSGSGGNGVAVITTH